MRLLTFSEAVSPHSHRSLGEGFVVDDPQGERLYALLRRRQSAQLLLQSGYRERGHAFLYALADRRQIFSLAVARMRDILVGPGGH